MLPGETTVTLTLERQREKNGSSWQGKHQAQEYETATGFSGKARKGDSKRMFGELEIRLYLGVHREMLKDLHQGNKVRAVFRRLW